MIIDTNLDFMNDYVNSVNRILKHESDSKLTRLQMLWLKLVLMLRQEVA